MAKVTKDDPWQLKTPPGTSDITLWRDPSASPPALVCIAGGAEAPLNPGSGVWLSYLHEKPSFAIQE